MGTIVSLRLVEDPSAEGESAKKGRRGKTPPAVDGRARYEIVGLPEGATRRRVFLDRELPSGGAEEYNAARKQGERSFGLWRDQDRQHVWARVVTASSSGKEVRYEVLGKAGNLVGTVTWERAFTRGHARTRWSVDQAYGPNAEGFKGRLFWWGVWWLISPVQCAVLVGSLVQGGGDAARMPRRIGYRVDGERVLDYGRGLQDDLDVTVASPEWDPRILAALTALHGSHDGLLGEPWDQGPRAAGEPLASEAACPVGDRTVR